MRRVFYAIICVIAPAHADIPKTSSSIEASDLARRLEQIEVGFGRRLSEMQDRLSAAEAEIVELRARCHDCQQAQNDVPLNASSHAPLHQARQLSTITRDAATSHHVWDPRPVVHQFADVTSCLGGVMTSSYGTLSARDDGTVQINKKDESVKKTVPPALVVHHAGDCSGPPTVHAELALYAEGGIEVTGSLRVGGADVSTKTWAPSVAYFPINHQLGAGTDARKVIPLRAYSGGASIPSGRLMRLIAGNGVNGGGYDGVDLKTWFACLHEWTDANNYVKCGHFQVAHSNGQLTLNQQSGKYKSVASTFKIADFDPNADWSTMSQIVNGNIPTTESDSGYGIGYLEYAIAL